jgi:ABC-type branched-subunit amino acid transport system substrate-binding protein
VEADSTEEPSEGVKAYEYLAEVHDPDLMVSGCIDDVSLAWISRMIEYKIPMIDTWTSAIRCINTVYETYGEGGEVYFMPHMNDYDQGAEYVAFANDIFREEMCWDEVVLYFEDTAYGAGVAEYVREEIAPGAGVEVVGEVMYDIGTFDFTPVYSEIMGYDPDFIFHICSVNCVPPSAAYVELEVPYPIFGVNVAACSAEFWDDMGGKAAGFNATMPPPTIGLEFDPFNQALIDKYKARYTERPIFPHFNGFNAYNALWMAKDAAEKAGGFKGEYLDAWVKAYEKEELVLWKYGGLERDDAAAQAAGEDADIKWQYYRYYYPGGGPYPEPPGAVFDKDHAHSCVLDTTGEHGRPGGMVMQWKLEKQTPLEDTVGIIHPPRWRNTDFVFVPWIPEENRGKCE